MRRLRALADSRGIQGTTRTVDRYCTLVLEHTTEEKSNGTVAESLQKVEDGGATQKISFPGGLLL